MSSSTISNYITNFPFPTLREKQSFVLKEIDDAFASGYNLIKKNISEENRRRLLLTDPEIQRDEIIAEHINTKKPTVLISPSLHLGLDLKDDLSRFQIITKVPYLSLGDKWIDEKRKRDEQWYRWQTALKLVRDMGEVFGQKMTGQLRTYMMVHLDIS